MCLCLDKFRRITIKNVPIFGASKLVFISIFIYFRWFNSVRAHLFDDDDDDFFSCCCLKKSTSTNCAIVYAINLLDFFFEQKKAHINLPFVICDFGSFFFVVEPKSEIIVPLFTYSSYSHEKYTHFDPVFTYMQYWKEFNDMFLWTTKSEEWEKNRCFLYCTQMYWIEKIYFIFRKSLLKYNDKLNKKGENTVFILRIFLIFIRGIFFKELKNSGWCLSYSLNCKSNENV